MKRAMKIVGIVLGALALLLAGAITLTIGWRPFIGPRARPLTNRKFEATPERLAGGKYLTENVLDCFACHSQRDWTKHDAPVVPGMEGGGQDPFALDGMPGKVYPPNISPDKETGAGNWTDDQLSRAIREGIRHDGRALFP
ncbi:MAG TPA: cytochrome C, partial [Terriglobia bacterium]|nr:cytochrome C [Terriglobia bacterium]